MQLDERLNNAPCGYLSVASDGRVLEINRTLAELLERASTELCGRHMSDILPPGALTFYRSYVQPMLLSRGVADEIFLSLKKRNGGELPVLVSLARRERNGETVSDWIVIPMRKRAEYEQRIINYSRQAEAAAAESSRANAHLRQARSELEEKQQQLLELNERLHRMAVTDPLTGLKNRYTFEESLHERVELSHRHPTPLALLLVDIDHFKRVNDNLGHQVGDRVLQRAARILAETSREIDVVARFGGEEFAIILPDTDREDALAAAERLRSSIENAEWQDAPITVSIGAASWNENDDEDSLLRKADLALYASKRNGRNRVTLN